MYTHHFRERFTFSVYCSLVCLFFLWLRPTSKAREKRAGDEVVAKIKILKTWRFVCNNILQYALFLHVCYPSLCFIFTEVAKNLIFSRLKNKSCQKVAEQLVAEANWGRSRCYRNARNKTCSETKGQIVGSFPCPHYLPLGFRGYPRPSRGGKKKTKKTSFLLSRVFPFNLTHENQPELFQYRLLFCRLNSFFAWTLHSTITSPNCHS